MPDFNENRQDSRIGRAPLVLAIAGALLSVCLPAGTFVSGLHAQGKAAAEPVLESPKGALTGNMLQLMRGIFFPAANTLFNVQTHDPALKKPDTSPNPQVFDWVQWGSNLYGGWDYVDYAAAMLAEATPLLLTPGRTCANGKPVPVERADWIKYTKDMLEIARKSYAAAKARNQEAVSDSTGDLSDACLACHRVFRDRRPPGVERGAPGEQALRCTAP
jgi:hypothetical protein